jgi:hypothetical protein
MNWRDRLREIKERLFSEAAADAAAQPIIARPLTVPEATDRNLPAQAPRIVAINLGIDFGTSFTKVCYRDLGMEESGVAAIGEGLKTALLPSIVIVSANGDLSLDDGSHRQPGSIAVTYLKMRLAGSPIVSDERQVAGIDLHEMSSVKALAAWFLASVISRSQQWMRLYEADRLKGRNPVWSANLGVPVEHYDSEALTTFEEVLGVAWLWVKDGKLPKTFSAALQAYQSCLPRLEHEVSDFHAIAEIAAAVQSFVMSREAVPGIYVYFDIGGGTVDGVAFDYLNYTGERQINFYSGKVESLGISAIAAGIKGGNADEIDAVKLEAILDGCSEAMRDDYKLRVQRVVAGVIMTAKKKDARDWQTEAIQSSDYQRKFIGQLPPHRMRPLLIFLGGGGSKSAWYGATIGLTYYDFQHDRAGIPPYKLAAVPSPKDLLLGDGDDFTRFAISYGLSIPFGEGPEIRLPSQFEEAEKPIPWTLPGLVDYADTKDVYD